ncbi:MAG: hypothetical protein RMY28_032330 [Nostoc sp. ChiSLP01]|nr:hypothetical protein [Nostoc sp. CmiSLP01]MDZ8284277.1 hypothetical protein [Nostoc sp. ChiSLP01]
MKFDVLESKTPYTLCVHRSRSVSLSRSFDACGNAKGERQKPPLKLLCA